jgi:hypothetical protein
MRDLVSPAIVRILDGDRGTPVGVGFLVGADTVLTCAHVVRRAVTGEPPGPGTEVPIDFPLLDNATARVATITVLCDENDGPDVAVLTVPDVPGAARALRVVAADGLAGHRVEAFGVTEHRPHGVWAEARVRGPVGDSGLQIEDDRSHGIGVRQGFSGSPLVDADLGAVVGMIARTEQRDVRRTAYALSGTALYEASPELTGTAAQPNPFRSLQPFRTEDTADFFGREALVAELLGHLDTHRVRLITGPSGAGKSSLVLAGLLPPLLAAGAATATLRPATGSSPWHALADTFVDHLADVDAAGATSMVAELAQRLRDGGVPDALNRVLARIGKRRLVVVIDQLDEGLVRDREATTAMLAALLRARARFDREPRVDVLVTVASEALTGVLEDEDLGPWFVGRTDTVGSPTGDDLRAVLTGPLAAPGLPVFENGLVDRLLADVAGEQNPLALIEFTLTLLWERQRRGVLTHDVYQELGGVVGALAQYAEDVSRPHLATEAGARRLRWVFGQLVSPVPPDRSVRRPVPLAQLGGSAELTRELAGSRLVVQRLAPGGEPVVELAHETLVRHWDRLRDWVEQDRQFRTWQDEVDRAAERFVARPHRSHLLTGRDLRTARTHQRAHPDELTGRQRTLIRYSVLRRRLTVGLSTATAVLIPIVGGLFIIQRHNAAVALQQRNAADAVATLLRQAPEDGARSPLDEIDRVVRAYRTQDTLVTRENLAPLRDQLQFATGLLPGSFPPLAVRPVSADGSALVLADPRHRLVVWTVTDARPAELVIPVPVNAAVTWLGSDRIATAAPGATSSAVWDARTGKRIGTLPFAGDLLVADPTGRWLAYGAGGSRTVRVADLHAPGRPSHIVRLPQGLSTGPQSAANSVTITAVLPDGDLLGGTGGTTTTDFGSGGTRPLPGPASYQLQDNGGTEPWAVACSGPAGQPILRAYGKVTGRQFGTYRQPAGEVVGLADCSDPAAVFSATGADVAVSARSAEGAGVYVGPVTGGLPALPLPAGFSPYSLVTEPSGADRVLLASQDSVLVLRVPPDPLRTALGRALQARVIGTTLVLVFPDGHLETWNTTTRRRTASTPAPGLADGLARPAILVNPDGSLVAELDRRSVSLSLFSLPGLRPVGRTGLAPLDAGIDLRSTALTLFTADRITLLDTTLPGSGSTNGEVPIRAEQLAVPSLRVLAGPVRLGSANGPGFVAGVYARAGSSTVAEITDSGLRQVDLRSGAVLPGSAFALPGGLRIPVAGVAGTLDSGGRRLAIDDADGVEVWELGTHQRLGRLALPANAVVTGLRFRDPDHLEIGLSGTNGGFQPGPLLTEVWVPGGGPGLATRLGFSKDNPAVVPDPVPVEITDQAAGDGSATLRSSDPRQWLSQICDAWRGGSADGLPVVSGAYSGSLCAGY